MDVGCGTGILSMFAAKAGAKLVIAIDKSDIIKKAKLNAEENGFGDRIRFFQDKVESVCVNYSASRITQVTFRLPPLAEMLRK